MSGEVSLADVYAPAERIVGRRIADEYVLVPIVGRGAEIDGIFNLNGVGAFIWERLDGRRDGAAIVAELCARYAVAAPAAERDYRAFIEQLLSIDAVRRA
ncbi:MAG: PqqD family protein [Vicinamibacteria bacterium]